MNQSKVSERYYLFEEVLEQTPGFAKLKCHLALHELTLVAGLVWAREGGRGACPEVKLRAANDASHYQFYPGTREPGTIHLAPKHRNLGGLLHELAHALGHRDKLTHGPAFRKRCIRLYKLYGDWNGEIE